MVIHHLNVPKITKLTRMTALSAYYAHGNDLVAAIGTNCKGPCFPGIEPRFGATTKRSLKKKNAQGRIRTCADEVDQRFHETPKAGGLTTLPPARTYPLMQRNQTCRFNIYVLFNRFTIGLRL